MNKTKAVLAELLAYLRSKVKGAKGKKWIQVVEALHDDMPDEDIVIAIHKKLGLFESKPASDEWYEDERFCSHCDKDTKHRCRDSTHERDSSADWQTCLVCGWALSGMSSDPIPPH